MSNLKRGLSLTLSSVMLMGIMAVGIGAKTLDFPDADQIVNKDAVEITAAIGIFDGYDDGSFQPTKTVTRAEMAVIVCKILYGVDVDLTPYQGTSPFTDVPAWANAYVNLCYERGIVAGVGDNKFAPNDPVTTAQAALMLSKALGYFDVTDEDAYAMGWPLESITQATALDLFGHMTLVASAELTRDNLAEMVLNTLEQTPVRYDEVKDVYYNGSGWSEGMLPVGTGAGQAESLMLKNFPQAIINPYLMLQSDSELDTDGTADVMLASGEMRSITVESIDGQTDMGAMMDKMNGHKEIYIYKQVTENGYALTTADTRSNSNQIKSGQTSFAGAHFATDTWFVDMVTEKNYTGYTAVPSYKDVTSYYIQDGGGITTVFIHPDIVLGELESDIVFVRDNTDTVKELVGDTLVTGYMDAYINGEKTEVRVDETVDMAVNTLYRITQIDENGVVKAVTNLTDYKSTVKNVSGDTFWATNNTTDIEKNYTVTDETIVVVVTTDETDDNNVTVSLGDIDSIFVDDTNYDDNGNYDDCVVRGMSGDNDRNLSYVHVFQTLK